ncbi:hypothetical protein PC9H_007049 [Pleurotus ostreatus]|uniref:Uncharacterized protein n=1 Tax=Pleurotus ostreatus TaxID=5322 RepID=A0A8H7DTW3_PLEOS|nr:uncharacterized protein PC9H_007049 [Pleurotus ostreatus]KAF7427833.1 hypothetical protein PC9H_007049 [Pleurotus ostreatus]KAJ8695828.1 hypothetical protein PTI98_005749 [Pleurotus ostreatus]
MASLPPIISLYIAGISPFINFIMIGVAWSASLIPLLIMLFYFSTPALRLQPIFIMNVLSVAVGIALGFEISATSIKGIRHPDEPSDTNTVIAAISSALLLTVFIDVILAFRLYVVLPRRTTSKSLLCIVFVPLAIFKVARLTNDILFIIKFASVLREGNPALSLMGFEHVNPYHKIEWCLLVADNCYASAFFLWKIGTGSWTARSSGIVSHAKDALTRLFYLGAAGFVLPCMLSVGQLIFAFRGSGGYDGIYIFLTNVYVEIICSLVATLWAAQSRFSDRYAPQQSDGNRISSFKVKSHQSDITNVEATNATIHRNSLEDDIVETNGDIDPHRAEEMSKDNEKVVLNNTGGNKWELNIV